ncbi:MAG: hypothetical protein ACKVOG_11735 [Rhodoglobus sp.]
MPHPAAPARFTEATEGDIRLELVSSSAWRVCDRRFLENDADGILGVIARTDDGYEAVTLDDPTTSRTHSSLAAAAASFWHPQFSGAGSVA